MGYRLGKSKIFKELRGSWHKRPGNCNFLKGGRDRFCATL